jgi:serine/threonine-protein kinase
VQYHRQRHGCSTRQISEIALEPGGIGSRAGARSSGDRTDFGIANVTGEDVATTTGTPAFAAPEQLLGEQQGPAADFFALAGIVYFTLTGDTPFGEDDARSILGRQLKESADLGIFPAVLATWFRTAFAAKPEDRFSDGLAIKEAWEAATGRIMARQRGSWWRRVVK